MIHSIEYGFTLKTLWKTIFAVCLIEFIKVVNDLLKKSKYQMKFVNLNCLSTLISHLWAILILDVGGVGGSVKSWVCDC